MSKKGIQHSTPKNVVATLAIPAPLPAKNNDHYLTGNYKGRKECHISPYKVPLGDAHLHKFEIPQAITLGADGDN